MSKINLGKRVKELRHKEGLSLIELSKASGVQLATLSRLENDKMTGTVEAHAKIAYILNVSLSEFYKGIVVKSNPLKSSGEIELPDVVTQGDGSSQLLTNNVSSKKLLPTLLTIKPGGKTPKEKSKSMSEEFIFVLQGSVEITVGDNTQILSEKNTFYFNPSEPHYFKNLRKSNAKLIRVRTQ